MTAAALCWSAARLGGVVPRTQPQGEHTAPCLQVVHGGGNDVLWLQRDFGLFLVNVFDTEKACQVGWAGPCAASSFPPCVQQRVAAALPL